MAKAEGREAAMRRDRERGYGIMRNVTPGPSVTENVTNTPGSMTGNVTPLPYAEPSNVTAARVTLQEARIAELEAIVTLLRAELTAMRAKGAERVAAYRKRKSRDD